MSHGKKSFADQEVDAEMKRQEQHLIEEHEALLRECESMFAYLEEYFFWVTDEERHAKTKIRQLRERITEHLHVGGLS